MRGAGSACAWCGSPAKATPSATVPLPLGDALPASLEEGLGAPAMGAPLRTLPFISMVKLLFYTRLVFVRGGEQELTAFV